MVKLVFTETYTVRATKFIRKHQEIIGQYKKALELLELNPYHPSLRLHKLKGRLSELHSVSINISYRIILELILVDNQIILVDIGTHDAIYR
ncbi:MAG: plasmid stabilization protein [Candidatus Marinimicrobia bacterium]|nr:plasmid stabilization protein [Candidatus Neomarinimicrobiota bacterium]